MKPILLFALAVLVIQSLIALFLYQERPSSPIVSLETRRLEMRLRRLEVNDPNGPPSFAPPLTPAERLQRYMDTGQGDPEAPRGPVILFPR